MKHLFIINPAAGSCNHTDEYSAVIHKICRARKFSCKAKKKSTARLMPAVDF